MSLSAIFLGFRISKDCFEQKFASQSAEVSHLEDRFDARTGSRLAKRKKVIDKEASLVYQYNGKNFKDSFVDLLENLRHDLSCSYWICHNDYHHRRREPDDIILGWDVDEMAYSQVIEKKNDVDALALALKNLGLEPGAAHFIQCFSE